jgi:hypothetical protein
VYATARGNRPKQTVHAVPKQYAAQFSGAGNGGLVDAARMCARNACKKTFGILARIRMRTCMHTRVHTYACEYPCTHCACARAYAHARAARCARSLSLSRSLARSLARARARTFLAFTRGE